MMDFPLSILRRTVSFKLNPIRGLVLSESRPHEWISTEESPVFELEPEGKKDEIPTGWVYIEAKLMRRGVRLVARLCVDTGAGYSDAESFVLPITRVGKVSHIVRLPRNVRGLRLEPLRGEGVVEVDYFRITKISRIEKYFRVFERVAGDIRKFKGTSQAKKYNLTWTRLLRDPDGIYTDCANLRFHSSPLDYTSYVCEFDTLHQRDIVEIKRHMAAFRQRPLISVLIPVGDASVNQVKISVQSIIEQIYVDWQLCLTADHSIDSEVVSYLTSVSGQEVRIKVAIGQTDRRLTTELNDALEMAAGYFATVVYPGDLLSPHALYFISVKLNESVDLDLVYSDEDEIDESGARGQAFFKSGWNPDLLLSHDMISHLAAYRTSLMRSIGGFRSEFEGGHDYDIALRFIKASKPTRIAHISRVLYHRRRNGNLAFGSIYAEEDVCQAQERALSDYLKDLPGVVASRGNLPGTYRVKYQVPTPMPKVSIIIPTRDGGPLLKKCVQSVLHKTDYNNIELIIVDNQSKSEETTEYLQAIVESGKGKVLSYDFPFNYSSINNFAVEHASGEILCFLNDDVEAICSDWLSEMVSHALRPEVGVVGAKLLYPDGFIQHAGVVIGIGGFAGHVHKLYPAMHPGYAGRAVLVQNLSAVTGACMVMRRSLFVELGGFDEMNLPVAFNDVDLCLRVGESGYRVLWTPYAVLYHYESYSRGDDQASPEKRARFQREKEYMIARWNVGNFLDPYYNDNLTLDREDFSLANFPKMDSPWRDLSEI
ncbi:glycosyltransferase family 2 protein [Burkholderia metallica]|uniref:glycosyltransferase family 2 protein n=1 Tax=Burkholderia metallica TaxID=488729 RepID=UPI001CF2FFBE|nr:glycosyltransferase [Burkholderia metallica]MCA8020311.1 glycosyltransferase [Burkholderia metallica]